MASTALRWTGRILLGLVVLIVLAALVVFILSQRALGSPGEPAPLRLAPPTPAQLADGPRQLKINGCASCHGPDLSGKLFLDMPGVAKLYAPNLTLLAKTADDAKLDRGIRRGIGHDGRALLVMPSAAYQSLTDQESAALIAAIRAKPVTGEAQPARSVGPLGRLGILNGKLPVQPRQVAFYAQRQLADLGPATAAGRHLVAVNCSECHGPDLKGKVSSPGVVSADLATVAGYDSAQFGTLLRTGVPPSGKDLGLMKKVALSDYVHLTDSEIEAIRAYLVAREAR